MAERRRPCTVTMRDTRLPQCGLATSGAAPLLETAVRKVRLWYLGAMSFSICARLRVMTSQLWDGCSGITSHSGSHAAGVPSSRIRIVTARYISKGEGSGIAHLTTDEKVE